MLVYNNCFIVIKMYGGSRSYESIGSYTQSQYQPKISSSNHNQTSIALFHIPTEAKNSIYVDGVPNDASEREVNRKPVFKFRHFPSISRFSANPPDSEVHFHRQRIPVMLC